MYYTYDMIHYVKLSAYASHRVEPLPTSLCFAQPSFAQGTGANVHLPQTPTPMPPNISLWSHCSSKSWKHKNIIKHLRISALVQLIQLVCNSHKSPLVSATLASSTFWFWSLNFYRNISAPALSGDMRMIASSKHI